MEKKLQRFFERYISKDSLFVDKKTLLSSHTPENVGYREQEINQMANILAPCLKNEKPSNLFIYGKTGTGKTLCTLHILNYINKIATERKLPIKTIYINCKMRKVADTEYRLMAHLCREYGKEVPPTGLPTQEIYKIFFNEISKKEEQVLIVLDEIEQLVKKAGDDILYNLIRANTELSSQITLIGISNNVVFSDHLDPRIKSSLSEEELFFSPYNAIQLQSILKERAEKAFKPGTLEEGMIEKCAAYAARDHGDARRAIELLRVSAELAERKNEQKVSIGHLDEAEEKIEKDRVIEIVATQPKQYQAVLLSIISTPNGKNEVFTGDIYKKYSEICTRAKLRPLTQRRVSDIIVEMSVFGVIDARVISKGRYGRSKEIKHSLSDSSIPKIKKMLIESLRLE
jgi:cell division control protein 6